MAQLSIGDVVGRGDDVGIVIGAEPYTELWVMDLTMPGPKRLWPPDTVRLVMTRSTLASILCNARDADDTGA